MSQSELVDMPCLHVEQVLIFLVVPPIHQVNLAAGDVDDGCAECHLFEVFDIDNEIVSDDQDALFFMLPLPFGER